MTGEIVRHVIISGRVQGVGYRAWTVGQAQIRGINGWVRNRTDGTVEAVFAGQDDIVNDMLEACKEGPLPAKVSNIATTPYAEPLASPGFMARGTA